MDDRQNVDWMFEDLNQPMEMRFRSLAGRDWLPINARPPNDLNNNSNYFRERQDSNRGNILIRPDIPNRGDSFDFGRWAYKEINPKNILNQILKVDLAAKANAKLHFTEKFDLVRRQNILIVRRGQTFTILIYFENEFNSKNTKITFIFDLGNNPNIVKGTKQVLDVDREELPVNSWGARQKSIQGNMVWVECWAVPNTPIGAWKVSIIVERIDSGQKFIYKERKPIFILFNPWNPGDSVYLEDESWRTEGVLNDVGKIWMGTAKDIHSRMWNYGQFEENILYCAFLALEISKLPDEHKGDPIQIARSISAVVNSLEEGGIIEGNWSEDYRGGTVPTEWQGSVRILQKYYRTRQPVKFGQCWVYAGITTTILRAFGIPARTISNYNSAHDVDGNLSVDQIYNEKMQLIDNETQDSYWTFHVWTECWMARPDLPKGYGGWQLLDGTPQEKSDNVHRCGPTSVRAISCGEVGLRFDTHFAFAEVNADVIKWIRDEGSLKPKFLSRDEHVIGQYISCVKPNSTSNTDDDRLDLTNDYKPPEMSAENKAIVLKALNLRKSSALETYGSPANDIIFKLYQKTSIGFGDDFNLTLTMKNIQRETRTMEISINLFTVYHTGIIHEKIRSEYFNVILSSHQSSECKLKVKAEDYLELINNQSTFHVTCLAVVMETNQVFSSVDDFNITQPVIQIEVHGGPLRVNKKAKLTGTFLNPLKTTLQRSRWILEAPGIRRPVEIGSRDIPGIGSAIFETIITPKVVGNKTILLSFSSQQLNDVEGYLNVKVS